MAGTQSRDIDIVFPLSQVKLRLRGERRIGCCWRPKSLRGCTLVFHIAIQTFRKSNNGGTSPSSGGGRGVGLQHNTNIVTIYHHSRGAWDWVSKFPACPNVFFIHNAHQNSLTILHSSPLTAVRPARNRIPFIQKI